MSIKDVTDIYSPIVATLALGWAVVAHFRDSRKLIITFVLKYQTFFGRIHELDGGERFAISTDLKVTQIQGSVGAGSSSFRFPRVGENNGDFVLTFSLINAGRRPITVRRWGVVNIRRITDPYIVPDSWKTFDHPAKIEESATFEFSVDRFLVLRPEELTESRKRFVVEDTHGKLWGLSGQQLRSLELAFQQYQEDMTRSDEYEGLETQIFTKDEFFGGVRRSSRPLKTDNREDETDES